MWNDPLADRGDAGRQASSADAYHRGGRAEVKWGRADCAEKGPELKHSILEEICTFATQNFRFITMSIRENRGGGRREDAPRRRDEEPATVYRPRTLRSGRSDAQRGGHEEDYSASDAAEVSARPNEAASGASGMPAARERYDGEARRDWRRGDREFSENRGSGRERSRGFERSPRRSFFADRDEGPRGRDYYRGEPRRRGDSAGHRDGFGGGFDGGRYRASGNDRGARGAFDRREGGYGREARREPRRYRDEGGYGREERRYGREEAGGYRPRTLRFESASDSRGGGRQGGYAREGGHFSGGRDGWGRRDGRVAEGRYGRPPRRGDAGEFASPRWQSPEAMAERAAQRRESPKEPPKMPQTMDPNEPIRLNRFIAHSGMCSRREADEMIVRGDIMVNGEVVTALGSKVVPAQVEVTCKGKKLDPERKVYILLNKPKDCFCTTDDPHAGRTVLDAVEGACQERIYPVGRLDRNSTGLLLLTNDGALTEQLSHPSYEKRKVYEVAVDRNVTREEMQRLIDGVELEEGVVQADAVEYSRADRRDVLGIEIHSGQNRVVRRMLDALGLRVQSLDRVFYAGLTKKDLPRGQWRFLTPREVANLKSGQYE